MTEESRSNSSSIVHEIPYLRLFPWLRLFSTPAAAAGPGRLILATIGIALMLAGWALIERIFPNARPIAPLWIGERVSLQDFDVSSILTQMTEPARLMLAPFLEFFDRDAKTWDRPRAALACVWTVVVWSLIGGAIARIAVVRLARGERLGIRSALRFTVRKASPLIGTPLIPLMAFALLSGAVALFGLLYRIPGGVGPTAAGLLAFVPLLAGFLLTLILVGLAAGWPLMPTSVAAEDEDGFDAMSRAYAYVHQRPWHYGFYIVLALAVGAFGLIVVKLFATLTIDLAAFALSFGGPSQTVQGFFHLREPASQGTAQAIHTAWLVMIEWLVRGWLFSYFWTAASAIYLLLRRDVDGMPWSKVALEKDRPVPAAKVETAETAEA